MNEEFYGSNLVRAHEANFFQFSVQFLVSSCRFHAYKIFDFITTGIIAHSRKKYEMHNYRAMMWQSYITWTVMN